MKKNCEYCGEDFKAYPSRAEKSRFCSRACRDTWRSGPKNPLWKGGKVERTCIACGIVFFVRQSVKGKFCSRPCAIIGGSGENAPNWQGGKIARTCLVCDKEFLTKPGETKRRGGVKYCSNQCRFVAFNGDGNPRWVGGKSFEPYPTTFNAKFKRLIRERDNYTCAICGSFGNSVHHINYIKDDTTPSNCITLCRRCHSKTNGNREYWQCLLAR